MTAKELAESYRRLASGIGTGLSWPEKLRQEADRLDPPRKHPREWLVHVDGLAIRSVTDDPLAFNVVRVREVL